MEYQYFKRDISWLSFNYRVLLEADDDTLPLYERINFILASYNAGEGHVKDAVALARKYGADPARWKGNVEKYLKLKSHERYFNDEVCRNGYFRGEETCRFVSDIRERHRYYQEKIKS